MGTGEARLDVLRGKCANSFRSSHRAISRGTASAAWPKPRHSILLGRQETQQRCSVRRSGASYHAFEAAEHKLEISPSDLLEAARLSGRFRLKRPITTLHNAVRRGYLDKGGGRGSFRINTVGENLVA